MTLAASDVTTPLAIRVLGKSRRLEIDWIDGRVTAVTHLKLRQSCRCATCVSQRKRGGEIRVSAEIELTSVSACGAGAVQLTFSDGHSRGIYPFSYLQSLTVQT